jgi:hypothetical protein
MANLDSESYHSLIGFLTAEYLGFLKLQVVRRSTGTGTCISLVPVNRNRGILTSLISFCLRAVWNLWYISLEIWKFFSQACYLMTILYIFRTKWQGLHSILNSFGTFPVTNLPNVTHSPWKSTFWSRDRTLVKKCLKQASPCTFCSQKIVWTASLSLIY